MKKFNELGTIVKNMVKANGISIVILAEKLNIHHATLYRKVNGEQKFTANELFTISRELNIDLLDLQEAFENDIKNEEDNLQ